MMRLLSIAALVVAFSLVASTSKAGSRRFHGGHGVEQGHHGGYGQGGFGYSGSHSNYGYGNSYGGQSHGYGNGYGYQPHFNSGYAPRYRSHGHQQRSGLHLDVGRRHFGFGGHH